jgi:regulator of sirC expression with transglutaminase-like and TPR domain
MRATEPGSASEIRDEGLVLYALKRYSECSTVLSEYLRVAPDPVDGLVIRSILERVQRLQGQ